MIKVNLLRSIGVSAQGSGTSTAVFSSPVSNDSKRNAIIRLAVILVFPILLFIYEKYNIGTLESELHAKQAELQEVEAKKGTYGDAAPRVERYTKQKAKIDKELDVVRAFARTRLREVKALDAIQSLITGKTWIKKLTIKGNGVTLEGYTQNDDGVPDLMRALEASTFFSKVVPKATTSAEVRGGKAKKFELDFQIGKQN